MLALWLPIAVLLATLSRETEGEDVKGTEHGPGRHLLVSVSIRILEETIYMAHFSSLNFVQTK